MRLCAAIGAALVLGHVLPYEAHGYWIVLTIALVLRPNFSITQQRQKDRLLGNLAGCVLAAALLATQPPAVLLLAAIFVANTVAHAFVTLRYRYTATAGYVIVLLQVHLTGSGAGEVTMLARVLDTVLDAMTDHEKLSLEVLDNETKSRAFALVILKMLTAAGGLGHGDSDAAV